MSLASPEIAARKASSARGAAGSAFATLLALLLVLAPVGYLLTQVWTANTRAGAVLAAERAAIAYGRPLNNLLAALVDARSTAARKVVIDDSGIRAAINEINRVDRGITELLVVDQRWRQLASEIDTALSRNANGADALAAYETPIAMTEELLEWVADSSHVTQDPAGSFLIVDVALHRLPEAMAAAGELAAMAATSDGGPASLARLAIGRDRLEHLTEEVGHALRSGAEQDQGYGANIGILRPLDEFAAASDEVGQTATDPDIANPALRERLELSSATVRTAAIALASAVFDAFNARLDDSEAGLSTERNLLLLAAGIAGLAAVWLLWMRVPWAAMRTSRRREQHIDPLGRHGRPQQTPPRAGSSPQLVDARELINREAADAGRTVAARKR